MLVVREDSNSNWQVAFGDYVKQTVKQEEIDSYSREYKKSNRMIVSSDDKAEAIESLVEKLNS
jgi:hypothetical protein